jgi:hypothetical protein
VGPALLVGVLADGRALDREQEVPEVLRHPVDRVRGGLAEQSLLGGGLEPRIFSA